MKLKTALTALTCAMISASCGKGMTKLTAEQKAQLSDTMQNTGRAYQTKSATSNTSRSTSLQSKSGVSSTYVSTSVSGDQQDQVAADMQKQITSAKCDMHPTDKEMQDSMSSGGATFPKISIGGSTCPITASLAIGVSQSSISLDADYAVNQGFDDFRKLNDVDAISLHGKGSGDNNGGNFNAKGTIHSQKLGNINLVMDMKAERDDNDAKITMTMEYDFPTFTAVLKAEGKGNDVKYTINDEEVSKEEFNSYFQKAGMGGAPTSPAAPANHSAPNTPAAPLPAPSPGAPDTYSGPTGPTGSYWSPTPPTPPTSN